MVCVIINRIAGGFVKVIGGSQRTTNMKFGKVDLKSHDLYHLHISESCFRNPGFILSFLLVHSFIHTHVINYHLDNDEF